MIHILYHSSDLDGKCSGAIAKRFFEMTDEPFVLVPFNYGDSLPADIQDGDRVFFLDVTIQPIEKMYTLREDLKCEVYVLDHHKTSVESYLKDHITDGFLDMKFSGCELTWKYFFSDKETPKFVSLLGRYDVWDNKDEERWNNSIIPFQMGMKFDKNDPEDRDFWSKYFEDDSGQLVEKTIESGLIVTRYQKNMNKTNAETHSYETIFQEKKAIVLNTTFKNTQSFEAVWDETKYDLMLAWNYSDKGYLVSLYTTKDDVDVSEIAKMFGGGGHKKAAGFIAKTMIRTDKLIFGG